MQHATRSSHAASTSSLVEASRSVRNHTEYLAAGLSAEDQCVQSMPDASPAKWHRAHTTWFFEQFVLTPHLADYRAFDDAFGYLFNSYYDAVGPRHPRPMRGLLTRPSAAHVAAYRAHVDAALMRLLTPGVDAALAKLVTLGLHHEQQHQELLVTDVLHALAQNPLAWREAGSVVLPGWSAPAPRPGPTRFLRRAGGLALIGHDGAGFAFDNESPRHQTYPATPCARRPPCAQCRLARFYRGWRIRASGTLDVGRLGRMSRAWLGGADALA